MIIMLNPNNVATTVLVILQIARSPLKSKAGRKPPRTINRDPKQETVRTFRMVSDLLPGSAIRRTESRHHPTTTMSRRSEFGMLNGYQDLLKRKPESERRPYAETQELLGLLFSCVKLVQQQAAPGIDVAKLAQERAKAAGVDLGGRQAKRNGAKKKKNAPQKPGQGMYT